MSKKRRPGEFRTRNELEHYLHYADYLDAEFQRALVAGQEEFVGPRSPYQMGIICRMVLLYPRQANPFAYMSNEAIAFAQGYEDAPYFRVAARKAWDAWVAIRTTPWLVDCELVSAPVMIQQDLFPSSDNGFGSRN